MSVTLRDVAKRCGLSPSTVSGVLNNRSNTWASPETRQRIREAAEALGYRPNQAARALRTGKTYVVAFLFHENYLGPLSTFDGTAEIMAGRLGMHGYELKLHVYPDQKELMVGLSDLVRRQSCDAILLFGQESDTAEQGAFLEQHHIPFVVKGRHERRFPSWYQVDYDHEGMMDTVVARFAARNRRRIAYIGFDQGGVYQKHLQSGFRNACLRHLHAPPPEHRIALYGENGPAEVHRCVEGWFTLPEEEQPDAIAIGTSDNDWHHIERTLARQGRIIGDQPGQVAVAGQASPFLHLAFGHGFVFEDTSFASIGQVAVEDLLLPLLRDQLPEPPVRRILPNLLPTKSLELRCLPAA
ncbi:MAG: LacI family DNA-binding transcriptional regulator [Capsulimonadales bacterium]|nr:LacI family DNA-binding transcriptional regulator [Capsulimonadales bacterium]